MGGDAAVQDADAQTQDANAHATGSATSNPGQDNNSNAAYDEHDDAAAITGSGEMIHSVCVASCAWLKERIDHPSLGSHTSNFSYTEVVAMLCASVTPSAATLILTNDTVTYTAIEPSAVPC